MGKQITYDNEEKQRAQEAVDFEGMARELKLTEEKAALLDSPTVWSHNDLLSGNILVSKQVSVIISAPSPKNFCHTLLSGVLP